jgi:hypothetical protein
VDDLEITELVRSLSRPHPSGGTVIERAAILAAGPDFSEIMDWILAHSGEPETEVATAQRHGLHGARLGGGGGGGGGEASRKPLRFVLPPGTLS